MSTTASHAFIIIIIIILTKESHLSYIIIFKIKLTKFKFDLNL